MGKIISIFLIMILTLIGVEFSKSPKNNSPKMKSIYEIQLNDINGKSIDLAKFKGKYMLFVNVASKCGFTKQYNELQQLYVDNRDKIVVIGVPCNQFGNQEPGNEKQISLFCSEKYNISFPLTEKLKVRGTEQHTLYAWLTSKELNGSQNSSVKWNFQKYLVSPDGNLVDYWYSLTSPSSSKITNYLK
jgi:glutathione peroxidase